MDVDGAWAMDQERRGGPVRRCSVKGFSWHSHRKGRHWPGMGSSGMGGVGEPGGLGLGSSVRGEVFRWESGGSGRFRRGRSNAGGRRLGRVLEGSGLAGRVEGGKMGETCVNFKLRRH